MVTSIVSNLSHSEYLNYQLEKALSYKKKKKKSQCYLCNSANKYEVATYLKFLSIGNLCSIKHKLVWLSELQVIHDYMLSATKTKDDQF